MKRRHLKLFEEYTYDGMTHEESVIFESIYAEWKKTSKLFNSPLLEQYAMQVGEDWREWLWRDEPLNAAEMAAEKRGDQVLNKRQMAVIYLAAKGEYDYGDVTEYVKIIPGIQDYDFDMPKTYVIGAVCDAFGIDKDRTFSYTFTKFKNHLTGEVEDPEVRAKQADYQKLRDLFYGFEECGDGPNDLALELADAVEAVGGDQMQARIADIEGRREQANVRAAERREENKSEIRRTGEAVDSFRKRLMDAPLRYSVAKALKAASQAIARDTGMEPSDVYGMYLKWAVDMKLPRVDMPANNWEGLLRKVEGGL